MYSLSYVVFFCPFLLQTLYIVYIRKRRKKERSGNKTEYLFVVVYYLGGGRLLNFLCYFYDVKIMCFILIKKYLFSFCLLRMIFPRSLEVTEQRSTKVAIAKQWKQKETGQFDQFIAVYLQLKVQTIYSITH